MNGTLSVSEEGNLGDVSGSITFDGGNLQVTGTAYTDMSPVRPLFLTEMGGGIDIADMNNVFTIDQAILAAGTGINPQGLWKVGDGSLVLNGTNTYLGLTDVREGRLVLGESSAVGTSASVLGDSAVQPGAILEGHGLIGGSLYNAGTVKPGTLGDIGNLTVRGNYAAMAPGGTVEFSLDGLNGPGVLSDHLLVDGVANLDGTTIVANKEGYFELDCGDNTVLIQAGTYSGNVSAFLYPSFDKLMLLVQQDTTLYGVNVGRNEGLQDLPGLNENQVSIATVISDEVLDGSSLLDNTDPMHLAVIEMIKTCGAAPGVLDQLSPESYAGVIDYGINVTRNYTRTAMMMPGAAPFTPQPVTPSSDKGGAKGGMAAESAPMGSSKRTTVFAGYSHFDWSSDSSSNGADYDITSNGGIVGARHAFSDVFSATGFLGFDKGDVSSRFVDADVDGWVLGGIVSYLANAQHNIIITGGVTYGSYEFDGHRATLGGVADFSGGDTDVWDFHVGVQGDVYKTDRFRLTPSLSIHYIDADTDSIKETGGLLPLSVRGMSEDALLAEIELRAEYAVTSNFLINGSIGYTHNFSDADRDVNARFRAGGNSFTVNAPGLGEDFFTAGVGAVWYINESFSLGAGYRAQFGSDSEVSNSVGVGLSYSF
jgi:subtilase-type serine protease